MQYGPVFLTEKIWFPPPDVADEDGLLAIGGDLSVERLLLAYQNGIFPWYDGPLPLWWNPDPRLVLFPEKLKISKSMQQVMRKEIFRFTSNACFKEVIKACGNTPRKGQDGATWITPELIQSYLELHHRGYARSFESWYDNQLSGGLYGIQIGNVFFGESMFANRTNASKAAFIWAVQQLKKEGITIIDCQVETPHLISLGAELITRNDFLKMLKKGISPNAGI
jgi:leucyl/phenylalanyl-tRNA--protein transferase